MKKEFQVKGKIYELNEDGYLANPEQWDESFAVEIAKELGINELTEKHMMVINYMREYYKQNGVVPTLRKVSKESGVGMKDLYSLFPDGPIKKAAKISGLPKPQSCV